MKHNVAAVTSTLLIFFVLFFASQTHAQAYNTSIDFMNASRAAVAIELPYPPDMVEKALKERLENAGLKKDGSKKGVINYKEVVLNDITSEKMDVYTKVERKSRSEKDKSIVYLLASKGYDNFITPAQDSIAVAKMASYLNGMMDVAYNYNVGVQVTKQEDVAKDAEKKLNKLMDNQKDLEKKKERIEKELVENAAAIEKQKIELETQKKILAEVAATRKN